MADPTSLDSALYRMKAYAKLLIDDPERNGIGQDLNLLCAWIEHAKPFLGDISIDAPGTSFSELQRRHGVEPRSPSDPATPALSTEGSGDAEKPIA